MNPLIAYFGCYLNQSDKYLGLQLLKCDDLT